MIYFIRKYYKYIFIIFSIVLVFTCCYIYYENNNSNDIKVTTDKKLSLAKKEDNNEQDDSKSVFVDIKGAINTPGVYELDESKRVIDVINLAGGLKEDASTINLNLSKKIEDEMYIIIYTKSEIDSYLNKNDSSKEIVCASKECICPTNNNDACIKNENDNTSNNDSSLTSNKVSINKADVNELMSLSGIGESKAKAIIEYRNEHGNFKTIEDIKNVSGIGDTVFEKIKDYISI